MEGLLVERDGLEYVVSLVEDSSGGSLVYAAALHADETVLNYVEQSDSVLSAELVQLLNESYRVALNSVNRDRNTLFKMNRHICGLVGSLFGRYAEFEEAFLVVVRLVRRRLEVETLVRQVPDVLVLGIVRLAVDLKRYVVCLGVVDLLVTRLDVPLSPRSDYRHVRSKRLYCQFEANLVVALSGAAVADRVRALFKRDFNESLCDTGASVRRAEQVVLVFCVSLEAGPDVFFYVFAAQVFNVELRRAGL